MKRVHRRWHRRLGYLLVPALAFALGLIAWTREAPRDNAALPPALTGTPPAKGP